MIFALAALAASMTLDPCVRMCISFEDKEVAAACKTGCMYGSGVQPTPLVESNDDRSDEVAGLLDKYCKYSVPASQWAVCYGSFFDFASSSSDCLCNTWVHNYHNDSVYCSIGCDFVRNQWNIKPWDLK